MARARFRIQSMERVTPLAARLRLAPEDGKLPEAFRRRKPGHACAFSFGVPGFPPWSGPFIPVNAPSDAGLDIIVPAVDPWTLALVDACERFPGPDANRPWTADVKGPAGGFVVARGTGPIVMIACGSDASPFLAVASDMARMGDRRRAVFLWSARTRDDLAGLDALTAAGKPAVLTIPILSGDPLWTGRRGAVDEAALRELAAPELADAGTGFWLSAPAEELRRLSRVLRQLGVGMGRIHTRRVPGRD